MRRVRVALSAVAMVLAAACLVVWVVGSLAVRVVTDDAVVTQVVSASLGTTQAHQAVVSLAQDQVRAQVASQGIDPTTFGIGAVLDTAVRRALTRDVVASVVKDQAVTVRAQVERELTREARPSAPLAITLDVNRALDSELGELSVGPLVLDVEVPPLQLQVMDAESFEAFRSGYGFLASAARWAGWAALVLAVVALAVAPRRRWVITATALGVAVAGVVAWVWINRASQVEGNTQADTLAQAVATEASIHIIDSLVWVIAIALAVAIVSAGVAIATRPRRRSVTAPARP